MKLNSHLEGIRTIYIPSNGSLNSHYNYLFMLLTFLIPSSNFDRRFQAHPTFDEDKPYVNWKLSGVECNGVAYDPKCLIK